MADVLNRAEYGAYKYQWSRYLARKSLERDVKLITHKLSHIDGHSIDAPLSDAIGPVISDGQVTELKLREIASKVKHLTFGKAPPEPGQFKVGIVGSGAAGLFTAMLIDKLNERSGGKLNITYDMLEATGPSRLGGRLYTYRFTDESKHQYYDVGAMRFPKNKVMDRTFRLFDYLDMKSDGENPALIPYYYADDNKVCPSYFNDTRVFGPPDFKKPEAGSKEGDTEIDIFGVNKWLPPDDPNRIPKQVIEYAPGGIVDKAIEKFTDKLRQDLDLAADRSTSEQTQKSREFQILFLRAKYIPELAEEKIEGPGYNFNTIEWLETYSLATGWYNQSLSEVLLETLDFGPPKADSTDNDYFWCIDGGTQLMAKRMADKLKSPPQFNKQVTAIEQDLKNSGDITLTIKSTPPDDWDKKKLFPSTEETRSYFTVFNCTTLGALQRMDTSKANLLYGTKQAIRSLAYGASCKVGIRFKTMWWMQDPWNITKGGLGRTDLPLRTCVYPSYNLVDPKDQPGVLLCSYTWAQDAQRVGTLIDPNSPDPEYPNSETELKNLMLSNLAQLHAKPDSGWTYEKLLDHLHDQYLTHHAYDWYHDPNMAGAFAWFGPGQFSQMWPEIIKPNGWLFLIGEAASAHHGWIVGALESSVRAVYQLLDMLNQQAEKDQDVKFDGYTDAMEFLRGPVGKPDDPDWKLPFVGLPREIPVRQTGTQKKQPLQETPKDMDVDLTFIAAQCIAAFFEMAIQLVGEEKAEK